MKQLISNYTFNAASKQVVLTDYISVRLENLLLITNVTDNVIVYNFADSSLGGVVSGNIITLSYNTVGMDNTDKLQIFYDDPDDTQATDESLTALQEQVILLRRMVKQTECLANVDARTMLRVQIAAVGTSQDRVGIIPCDNNGSQVYIPGAVGSSLPTSIMYTVPDFWRVIELARASYNTGIRSQLTFS